MSIHDDIGDLAQCSMKTLAQLFQEHDGKASDKWSLYMTEYERLFARYRNRQIRILEIGIQNGGSLEIWSKYFQQAAKIVGCDINPDCAQLRYEDPRISIVIGNANTERTRHQILKHAERFDIVIDDGSHHSKDIIRSFAKYFPCLSDDGLYVVEDLHCSYWKEFSGGLYHPGSSITFFKLLVDVINREHWGIDKARSELLHSFEQSCGVHFAEDLLRKIHSLEFLNSLCVIEKQGDRSNLLGPRIVAGASESIAPVRTEDGPVSAQVDQRNNRWADHRPPSEEELLRVQLLAETELAEREAALSEARTRLDAVTAELTASKLELDEAKAELAASKLELDEAKADLAANRQEVALGEVRRQLKSTTAALANSKAELVQQRANAARQRGELEGERARSQERAAAAEAVGESLRAEHDLVLNSTFWRSTAPARRLAAVLPAGLRRQARRGARALYWILTPHRTAARLAYLRAGDAPAAAIPEPNPELEAAAAEQNIPAWAECFDRSWYLERYPDVAASPDKADPLNHFIVHGATEGRDPNPFFDTSWYLETNPDIAQTGVNPLQHYFEHGAAEGRDPSPLFNTSWYLDANSDVAEAGINPLLHYIKYGAAEGRAMRAADSTHPPRLTGEEFVHYRLDRNGALAPGDDVLIYVAYCPDGVLSAFHTRSIGIYAVQGYRVVLVVNSGAYSRMVDPGETPAFVQIVRENIGFDFGAWAHALRLIGGLEGVRSVTFTNDSLIGPLTSRETVRLRTKVEEINADVVFLTENAEIQKHLQSYFFVLKGQALAKAALQIVRDAPYAKDKETAILDFELPLFSKFKALGLATATVFPCPQADLTGRNPTIHFWRELCASGFPFVKVTLIAKEHVDCEGPELQEVVGTKWVELLKAHLQRRVPFETVPTLDANVPALPAFDTQARFGDNGALQAYNPPAAQVSPVIVPLDDLDAAPSGEARGSAVLAAIHCFYIDEAEIILRDLASLPLNLRCLLITDTEEKAAQLETLLARFGLHGEMIVGQNRGRNLAPFVIEVPRHLREETIILHLHTKKSPHDSRNSGWAAFLRRNLIGSPEIVRSILHLLAQPEIGVVYSEHFEAVRGLRNWGFDFPHARRLMQRLGVTLTADDLLDFPTGAMFWAKTEALRPLFDLGLTYEDFEPEAAQVDGTLAHAVERCILYVAEARGFSHQKVIARGEVDEPTAISSRLQDIGYMLMHKHQPRLLGGAGARPFPAAGEIYPMNVARSARKGRRLNILIPTMKPAKIYGGVATAIRCARALFAVTSEIPEIRVIVTSDDVDTASMHEIATRFDACFSLAEPNNDAAGMLVVDLCTRRHLPLTLRAGDIFFATAWWTAHLAFRLHDRQAQLFGSAARVVYFIQDYEAGFYNWSDQYVLAQATLTRGKDTIALFNSEELANFVTSRHSFPHAFHVPYVINPAIEAHLKPAVKKKKIIAYSRPGTPRNLFHTLVEGVRIWQGRDPANCSFEVLFGGEWFPASQVASIENAKVLGKKSLQEYAELLNETAIGISLMLSPHPSYPPLEMARAGCVTITNYYERKHMTGRADNIISLDIVTAERLADALDLATKRICFDAPTPLATIRNIATPVPAADYGVIAQLVASDTFHFRGYAIPVALLEKTGGGPETFEMISDGHIADLQRYIGIKETDHVIEIGCGIGRDAIPLTKLLMRGHYIGTDTIGPSIQWCQDNITKRFPNFIFVHHDIHDTLHNPTGVLRAADIKLPAEDNSIDLIVLQSVFTHMFTDEIMHYLKEFQRVLKPTGRVWATFFIVDEPILDAIRNNPQTQYELSFRYPYGNGCYINVQSEPRGAVAFELGALTEMLLKTGLSLEGSVIWGDWSGRRLEPKGAQDALILKKSAI